MASQPVVGLIGVGLMGHGIARNVAGKGFSLYVLEHPGNQPLNELLALGTQTCKTPAELAAHCDVIILCVTGSPQVEAVLTGDRGVLSAIKPGTVIIDCSTAVPVSTVRMAQAVQAAGGQFIDAPMTKTSKAAHDGTLNLLVGGDAAVLAQVQPLLATFTEKITHVGTVGDGHRMKLLHNFVSIGQMTLLAEATACARKEGMNMQAFYDVLAGGGGAGVALDRFKSFILADDPSGIAFSISNAAKDLSYYAQMAHDAQAPSQVADAAAATLKAEVDAGHGDAMLPETIAFLSQR
ncbi:MAG: NAD(P)-dependent oxidoreductase [Comamonas sp.]